MSASAEDYAHSAAILAERDRDLWLASLFIPEAHRPHIHALHAFSHEIARVPDIVSSPQLGEIRLQWWQEVLEGVRTGEGSQNPVSAALLSTIAACHLPVAPLVNLIEARRFDLYSDPMPSMNDLEGYCGETSASLFRLGTLVLNNGADPGGADACGHAGVTLGLTNILRALPSHAARAQCYLPKDVLLRHGAVPETAAAGQVTAAVEAALAELRQGARKHFALARNAIAELPAHIRPAFVPLAVVPLYLKAMEKRGFDPFRTLAEAPQWRRQFAMWRW